MKRLIALVFVLCLMVPVAPAQTSDAADDARFWMNRYEQDMWALRQVEERIRALELELFGPQYGNGDPRCSIYFDDNECLPGERFCSYWAYQEPFGCHCVLWWIC